MTNKFTLHNGDCLEVLKTFADNSIDSIVTDPPYGISFMAHKWDHEIPSVDVFRECLRVLKPGGHILCFAGTKTQHRMAVNIEDAGFEIRDMIGWMYGSGFPKSMDVSKAIDKAAGATRTVISERKNKSSFDLEAKGGGGFSRGTIVESEPATDEALKWNGWGTALKPAFEPITVARKPFKGTVAANVLAHGTGAINIDKCRVPTDEDLNGGAYSADRKQSNSIWAAGSMNSSTGKDYKQPSGRWPANIIHDGSPEVQAIFPSSAGAIAPVKGTEDSLASNGNITGKRERVKGSFHSDSGSAARFFYCAKTSPKDRHEGLEKPSSKLPHGATLRQADNQPKQGNYHSTVKPFSLMKYLCELFTPVGGIVLDPFMGSGSTGKAAIHAGFNFIGVELDAGYFDIARKRLNHALGEKNGA